MARPGAPTSSRTVAGSDFGRNELLAALGLAALVIVLYANSLSGGFVFDSSVLVLEDARLHSVSLGSLRDILQHSYWWPHIATALYRPATTLSFLANYSLLGHAEHPAGYHATNIALHALNSCLLFALLRRVLGAVWPAALAAAWWAAHPLGTEAVANVVGRADLLAATGVLAALTAHVGARASVGRRRALWLAAVGAASALAAFSKESGVTVVAVIALFDLVLARWEDAPHDVASWVASAIPVALFLGARAWVIGSTQVAAIPFVDNPIIDAGFVQGRLTALSVAGRYLWLALWPSTLSADYSFPQIPLASGSVADWVGWTMVASAVMTALVLYRLHRRSFFLIAAAAVTFLPASNLLFATGTIMGERLAYLPLAFLAGLVAVALFKLQTVTGVRNLAPALLALVIVALGARTMARNRDWHSELSLWSATVEAAPLSFKSHSALAEALYDADTTHANFDRVVAEKEISLSRLEGIPRPAETSTPFRDAAAYYLERGDLLQRNGAGDAATRSYHRAAELIARYLQMLASAPPSESERAHAQLMLATVQERLQNGVAAIDAARTALSNEPLSAIGYRTLAAALLSARQPQDAATTLMTGFMLTGQPELRAALIEVYNAGLDVKHCAVTSGAAGPVLNVDCEVVRRTLCVAAAAAASVQRRLGREDLARQAELSTGGRCADR